MHNSYTPIVTIIIPTFNEEKHIEKTIRSILDNDDYPKEVIVVDGGSSDGTVAIVKQISKKYKNVRLLYNSRQFANFAFNTAILSSKGVYVAFVGAHAIYPKNYFLECIKAIDSGKCEVAGGFLLHKGLSPIGQAIAAGMGSKLGVGNTAFRTIPKEAYVDSVAFAVYKRTIFETVGLLDERLVRNQDDEFHYRINQAGFRILLLPHLEVIYQVRESLSKLFHQYFQYGLYKPLVLKKVKSGIRLRHLVPAAFVLYLLSLPFVLWLHWAFVLPLVLYVSLIAYKFFTTDLPFQARKYLWVVFPAIHLAYGLGFLMGLGKLVNHRAA